MTKRSRSPWIHLFGTSIVLAVVQVVVMRLSGGERALWLGLPSFLYGVLPMVTGVSALWIDRSSGVTRTKLILVAVASMLVMDAISKPRLITLRPQTEYLSTGVQVGREVMDLARVSALGTASDWVRGRMPDLQERGTRYAPGHSRPRAALAIQKGALLLMPWLLVGVVLGVVQWLRRSATFIDPARGRLFELTTAWCVVLIVQVVVAWAVDQAVIDSLHDGALPAILAPYLFLGALSFAGWRSIRAGATEGSRPQSATRESIPE